MEKANPIEVGHRIRQIRLSLNKTQKEFGETVGLAVDGAKSAVSNWELGKNKPNAKRLNKVAELGGISINQLLYGSEVKQDRKISCEDVVIFLENLYYTTDYLDLFDIEGLVDMLTLYAPDLEMDIPDESECDE